MVLRYAVDTNVLSRLSHRNHPQHGIIRNGNVGEFWNVSTRPVEHNGFGLAQTEGRSKVTMTPLDLTIVLKDAPAGEWIALSNTRARIVATARTLEAVVAAARAEGEKHPVVMKVPPVGALVPWGSRFLSGAKLLRNQIELRPGVHF